MRLHAGDWMLVVLSVLCAAPRAHAETKCDTLHTSDSRGKWQCGNVCVYVLGNSPRQVIIDNVDSYWGGEVHFKWSYKKAPFAASLNGKRCKMLKETYDYEKSDPANPPPGFPAEKPK